jgi:hypothetical protein
MSFFPACQLDFSDGQRKRLHSMEISTNAQENVGRQFQRMWGVPDRKLSINEAVLNCWRWSNRDDISREEALTGAKPSFGFFNKGLDPKARKNRRFHNDGRAPDKNSTLFTSREPSSSTVPSNYNQVVVGPKWGFKAFGSTFTNTCSLDSFLVLLYGMWKSESLLKSFAELDDSNSLLTQTFQLIDKNNWDKARILWLEGIGWNFEITNLFGTVSRFFEPSADSSETNPPTIPSSAWVFNQERRCELGDKCAGYEKNVSLRQFAPKGATVLQMGMGWFLWRNHKRWVIHLTANETLVEALNHFFGVEAYDNCFAGKLGCKARSSRDEAEIVNWPHIAMFEVANFNGDLTLDEIPTVFKWRQKKFIFRGFIMGDGIHFTAALRMPSGWLHFDDMANPRFKFFGQNDGEKMMGQQSISLMAFEIVSSSVTKEFGNMAHSWDGLFAGIQVNVFQQPFHKTSNKKSPNISENPSVDAEKDKHKASPRKKSMATKKKMSSTRMKISHGTSIVEQLQNLGKELQNKKTKEKQRRNSRVVMGWSIPKNNCPSGPLPICRGCHHKIKKTEERIRNNHREQPHHEYPSVHQYHIKASCLMHLKGEALNTFLAKKWPQKNVQQVQNVVKMTCDDSEEDN